VNQIVDWTGFFRDESGGHSYTDVASFETSPWFESSDGAAGTLTTNYLTYEGAAVQPAASFREVMPPCPASRCSLSATD